MNINDSLDFLLKVGSLVAVVLAVNYAFRDVIAGFLPKPPPYKPKPYRVTVEADDGWPMRSYTLPREAAARLVNQLDRDRDNDKPA